MNGTTIYDTIAMANAAAADVCIVKLANGLQNIEDPRLRFFTVALFFHIACTQLGVDAKRIMSMVDVSVKNAYNQDTAEMRGMIDFIRAEVTQ